MQLPLLSGVVAKGSEWVPKPPLNLEPVLVESGISKGQFRAPSGAVPYATGPGIDRGGVNWNGTHLRVMGTSLVRVNGDASVDTLGDVGGSGPVSLDYGFDRLGIRSGTSLYYWNGTALSQVTDSDLGPVLDMMWVDGYFMTTDGTSIPVTELSDPTSVMPLKYGSAEVDPDPVTGLIKNRITDEPMILGRYTIQLLQNVGGNGFPFAEVAGSTLPVGCVAPAAKAYFGTGFAFVGSGRQEALGVHFVAGQGASKISTRAVDDALAAVEDPSAIEVESRIYRGEERLLVHTPAETWVYLLVASGAAEMPLWYRMRSGVGKAYRPRHAVLVGSSFYVGDTESSAIGILSEDVDSHFGEDVEWKFEPGLIYNGGSPAILHEVELIGLTGRGTVRTGMSLSLTVDGQTYGAEKPIFVMPGSRSQRLRWWPHRRFQTALGLKIRGVGGRPGFSALEATVQPL